MHGHTLSQKGMRPNKEETDAFNKLIPPTNTKNHFLARYNTLQNLYPTFLRKYMRHLLKKGSKQKCRFQQNKARTDKITLPSTLQR